MTKDILVQYCELKEEIKEQYKRKEKLEDRLRKIAEEGDVTDSVACGKKGKKALGNVKVTGFPHPEYSRVKTALTVRMAIIQESELELLELTNEVEEYITSLDNSRIRRLLRFRYIDNMTWVKVAINMRGNATEKSVQKEHERFLQKEMIK